MAKRVEITETVLRDSHQSLIATRMTTDEILPILPEMDEIGYHSLEAWGGATFDACLRFLNEDPWERLRKIRDKVKKTKLQMLFRQREVRENGRQTGKRVVRRAERAADKNARATERPLRRLGFYLSGCP